MNFMDKFNQVWNRKFPGSSVPQEMQILNAANTRDVRDQRTKIDTLAARLAFQYAHLKACSTKLNTVIALIDSLEKEELSVVLEEEPEACTINSAESSNNVYNAKLPALNENVSAHISSSSSSDLSSSFSLCEADSYATLTSMKSESLCCFYSASQSAPVVTAISTSHTATNVSPSLVSNSGRLSTLSSVALSPSSTSKASNTSNTTAEQQQKKEISCSICMKRFSSLALYTEHKVMHTDLFPFPCHCCSKKFKLNSHLSSHLRVHAHKNPFKCAKCNSKFKTAVNRREHYSSCKRS